MYSSFCGIIRRINNHTNNNFPKLKLEIGFLRYFAKSKTVSLKKPLNQPKRNHTQTRCDLLPLN